ncbi:MAG: ExbD/TolR family protein [Pirellulaceae bacterium]
MKIKRVEAAKVEIDMTPMIDICFQLLTFFVFILNFESADQNARIMLPASELAKPPENVDQVPIMLQVTKEGHVLAGGQEFPTPEAAKSLLNQERIVLEQRGKSVADANIIIRAHKDAKTGDVQKLIKTAQEVEFVKFSLRAKDKE